MTTRWLTPLVVVLTSCHVHASASRPLVYYVAPTGDDAWSGRRVQPGGNDGPFRTLERARDAVRALTSLPPGGVTIELAAGDYLRDGPFVLEQEDSGSASRPIVYRAAHGADVHIVGGRVVTAFTPVTDPAALSRLDPSVRGHVVQADLRALGVTDYGTADKPGIELFFDSRPMVLARWPNSGFVTIENVSGAPGSPVLAVDDDRPQRWIDEPDVWLQGYWYWDWADQRQRVTTIDPARHTLALAPPFHQYGYRKGQWFYAYNILAELDAPGEWYVDRTKGLLYFWPPGPIDRGRATVSVTSELLEINHASHVAFEGLTFEVARGTAIEIKAGHDDRIASSSIRNVGSWGVRIIGGDHDRVDQCEISDTGEGGIWLEGGARETLVRGDHVASGNHIHDYSRWKRTVQPAIAIYGVGQTAVGNVIYDAPNEGISFSGNDHRIERNVIHDVCTETNDAGAIYAGRDWTMRGTTIRQNIFHDLAGRDGRGCNAVYLDDLFSGTEIVGNVFDHVSHAVFIGGGRDNEVSRNVFAESDVAIHLDARGLGWAAASVPDTMTARLQAMPFRGELWRARYPRLASIEHDAPAEPRHNRIDRNVASAGRWLEIDERAQPLTSVDHNAVAERAP